MENPEEDAPPLKRARTSPDDFSLFLEALELCRHHRLQEDLDLVEVAHLRLTSKGCGRVAARIARHRLKSLRLTYKVVRNMHWRVPGCWPSHHGNNALVSGMKEPLIPSINSVDSEDARLEKHITTQEGAKVFKWDWKTPIDEEKQRRLEAAGPEVFNCLPFVRDPQAIPADGFVEALRDGFLDSAHDTITVTAEPFGDKSADDKWLAQSSYPTSVPFQLGEPSELEANKSRAIVGRGTLECEILDSKVIPIAVTEEKPAVIHHQGSFRVKSVTWDFRTLLEFILYEKESKFNRYRENLSRDLNQQEQRLQDCIDKAEEIVPHYATLHDG